MARTAAQHSLHMARTTVQCSQHMARTAVQFDPRWTPFPRCAVYSSPRRDRPGRLTLQCGLPLGAHRRAVYHLFVAYGAHRCAVLPALARTAVQCSQHMARTAVQVDPRWNLSPARSIWRAPQCSLPLARCIWRAPRCDALCNWRAPQCRSTRGGPFSPARGVQFTPPGQPREAYTAVRPTTWSAPQCGLPLACALGAHRSAALLAYGAHLARNASASGTPRLCCKGARPALLRSGSRPASLSACACHALLSSCSRPGCFARVRAPRCFARARATSCSAWACALRCLAQAHDRRKGTRPEDEGKPLRRPWPAAWVGLAPPPLCGFLPVTGASGAFPPFSPRGRRMGTAPRWLRGCVVPTFAARWPSFPSLSRCL